LSVEIVKTEYLSELRQKKLICTKWWFEGKPLAMKCGENSQVPTMLMYKLQTYRKGHLTHGDHHQERQRWLLLSFVTVTTHSLD
jgi:hypothetical protein